MVGVIMLTGQTSSYCQYSCSNTLSCFMFFKALQLDIIAHTLSLKLEIISYNVGLSCFKSYIIYFLFVLCLMHNIEIVGQYTSNIRSNFSDHDKLYNYVPDNIT